MKNSNDTIGGRNRDLPACSAVPQTNCATACPFPITALFKKFYIVICVVGSESLCIMWAEITFRLVGTGGGNEAKILR